MGLGFTVVAVTVDLVLEAAATPAPVVPSAPIASVFRTETLSLLDITGEGTEVMVAGVPVAATFDTPERVDTA